MEQDEVQNKSNKKDIDDDELLKSGKLFPGDLEIKSFDDIPEELKEEEEIVMALKELCRAAHDPMVIKLLKMREEKNMK
ncbi:MAG: hypothetical protein ABRQ39_30915 [Candidatus Eremiobacterota bacterium]